MRSSTSVIRLVLAISLLCAQTTGGFARVVHCYDSKCVKSGASWECHVNCVGGHFSECEGQCDHELCDPPVATTTGDLPDIERGMAVMQSGPCGSDHHHHYISSIDLSLVAPPLTDGIEFLGVAALFELPAQVLEATSLRLPTKGRNAGRYPSIPLVTRLRI